MREVRLEEVGTTLAAVVDEARRGEPSIITRSGQPEAVIVGIEEWERLSRMPSFGRLLMAAPFEADDAPERDARPLRDAEL